MFGCLLFCPLMATKYYVIFVDHFTKYVCLYPLKLKSDVFATFGAFKALVENYFKTTSTTLYSDNGGEYIALRPFLTSHGITHLTTPPHTPENNGLARTMAPPYRRRWPCSTSSSLHAFTLLILCYVGRHLHHQSPSQSRYVHDLAL